jgi:hypothetical protein
MEIFVKDPDSTVDYGISWGAGYLSRGEIISSSSWSIFPIQIGGLEIEGSPTFTETQASVFVKGGIERGLYRLTNRIITSKGRTDERTLTLKIGEK